MRWQGHSKTFANQQMRKLAADFHELSIAEKRHAHLCISEYALSKWYEYCASRPPISYVETVCGTHQTVDTELPAAAFCAACEGNDSRDIAHRFLEPISAMQENVLTFPEPIEYAYYALYNLFRKYAEQKDVDDWLIVTQVLSIEVSESQWRPLLETAIQQAKQLSNR